MERELSVVDIFDDLVHALRADAKRGKYQVRAVLNAGEGPDENLLTITGLSWDDDMGYYRLEVE